MSNSVFMVLFCLLIGGFIVYKTNKKSGAPASISKNIKKIKKAPVKIAPIAQVKPAEPVIENTSIQPTVEPVEQTPVNLQVSTPEPPKTQPSDPKVVAVPVTDANQNVPPVTATYFEINTSSSPEDKVRDLTKLVTHYRHKLEEMYQQKKLYYEDTHKVDSLLSDTSSYLMNPETYAKDSNPVHLNDLKEFMGNVYALRDEGNRIATQNKR